MSKSGRSKSSRSGNSSSVGSDVGSDVGSGVETVVASDAKTVGSGVEAVVASDDKIVGSKVGVAVGSKVGVAVGSAVGVAVGSKFGVAVGSNVGEAVGSNVGEADGSSVICAIGIDIIDSGVPWQIVLTVVPSTCSQEHVITAPSASSNVMDSPAAAQTVAPLDVSKGQNRHATYPGAELSHWQSNSDPQKSEITSSGYASPSSRTRSTPSLNATTHS